MIFKQIIVGAISLFGMSLYAANPSDNLIPDYDFQNFKNTWNPSTKQHLFFATLAKLFRTKMVLHFQ